MRDLFAGRFAAQFLHQRARSADQLVDRFDHVHRNTDRARLVGDRAGDRLADPPRRVGRELITAPPFEFVDGLHQTDVAFLNQIEELQSAVRVFLGDRNDQTQVGFDQFAFGLTGLLFADDDRLQRPLDLDRRDDGVLRFDRLQALLGGRNVLLVSLVVVGFEPLLGRVFRCKSTSSRSAVRTSFCTLRIALISRWRERSVMIQTA